MNRDRAAITRRRFAARFAITGAVRSRWSERVRRAALSHCSGTTRAPCARRPRRTAAAPADGVGDPRHTLLVAASRGRYWISIDLAIKGARQLGSQPVAQVLDSCLRS